MSSKLVILAIVIIVIIVILVTVDEIDNVDRFLHDLTINRHVYSTIRGINEINISRETVPRKRRHISSGVPRETPSAVAA